MAPGEHANPSYARAASLARSLWLSVPDDELLAKEARDEIDDCLEAAPEPQRLAFHFREVDGLSTKEICKILGVSATNLGVMLHRVRNRLRDCLETKWEQA